MYMATHMELSNAHMKSFNAHMNVLVRIHVHDYTHINAFRIPGPGILAWGQDAKVSNPRLGFAEFLFALSKMGMGPATIWLQCFAAC